MGGGIGGAPCFPFSPTTFLNEEGLYGGFAAEPAAAFGSFALAALAAAMC